MAPEFFMHSQDSGKALHYDARRLGSRHAKVRDVRYEEAVRRMGLESEAWLHKVRSIIIQMDVILVDFPAEHVPALAFGQNEGPLGLHVSLECLPKRMDGHT